MPNPVARIRILTGEMQGKILHLLSAGNYISTACEASGLTYQAFRHWQRRCEEGDPSAAEFVGFFEKVAEAVRVGEAAALMRLMPGNPGWQAQAWFLERRFPQRWGKKDQVIVKGRDVKKLTDEELRDIAEGKG